MTKSEYDRRIVALYQRYPGLFKKYPAGAEPRIAPGWLDLFEQLCSDIDALKLPGPYFEDIGEKYGELRLFFRITGNPEDVPEKAGAAIGELLEAAEDRSGSICMWCGAPGRSRGGQSWMDWVFTACDKHNKGAATFYEDVA